MPISPLGRTRMIYQTDAVFVGPTGNYACTGQHFTNAVFGTPLVNPVNGTGVPNTTGNLIAQLYRIQKADYSWNKTLKDVNQFGELAYIDRVPLEQPTVSLNLSYLLANFVNENRMGLTVSQPGSTQQVSAISGILAGTTNGTDSDNYFLLSVSEGLDANGTLGTGYTVTALGNVFLNSYSTTASVGNFPTADVSFEALNIQVDPTNSGAYIPAIIPSNGTQITGWTYALPNATQNIGGATINSATDTLSVLQPGSITLNLGLNPGDGFWNANDLKLQSYTLSFNLRRENLLKLGSKYAFAKVPKFPISVSLQVSADVGEFQTGNLMQIIQNNNTFNPSITITQPNTTTPIIYYQLVGAKLDNQDVSSSIGPNKSVSMTFSSQIGGPSATTTNLYMSGIIN